MKINSKTIEIKTKKELDIINITDEVKSFIADTGVKNGIVNIQSMHTTASVLVQEEEPLLLEDIKIYLNRIVPKTTEYNHDDFTRRTVNMCDNECRNGHSHCKAINLPTSVVLNIFDGKLQLGRWQVILFIELDRERDRKVNIQIMGE